MYFIIIIIIIIIITIIIIIINAYISNTLRTFCNILQTVLLFSAENFSQKHKTTVINSPYCHDMFHHGIRSCTDSCSLLLVH